MERLDEALDVRGQGEVDRHDGSVVPDPSCRLEEALAGCLRRIRWWRIPPGWSAEGWWEEARAEGIAAAWQALRDHDPTRGIPLGAFVYRRIWAGVRTRYRQEWAYGLHRNAGAAAEACEDGTGSPLSITRIREALPELLARLAEPDRRLIEHLFWDGWTEAEVAYELGLGQSAVSKRKRSILIELRRLASFFAKNEE
ncbi:MAG: sigma-70 family RNA polymerase sigma factor [Isosphaeraceae bacterium]|nr:sigma-70 family RNA polymerase sigma factor [Isosphaeraceae bacterium]